MRLRPQCGTRIQHLQPQSPTQHSGGGFPNPSPRLFPRQSACYLWIPNGAYVPIQGGCFCFERGERREEGRGEERDHSTYAMPSCRPHDAEGARSSPVQPCPVTRLAQLIAHSIPVCPLPIPAKTQTSISQPLPPRDSKTCREEGCG